uniref:Uncharacterized protein n=1 Tax=Ciona savignyi TaxID=51511 RepID=H2YES0_CIOSA
MSLPVQLVAPVVVTYDLMSLSVSTGNQRNNTPLWLLSSMENVTEGWKSALSGNETDSVLGRAENLEEIHSGANQSAELLNGTILVQDG